MRIWLLQANEPMPIVDENQRLFRTGMLAKQLDIRKHEITWFATTFNHFTKKQRFEKNTMVSVNEHYKLQFIYSPGYKKNISVKRIVDHKYMGNELKKVIKKMEKPDLIYVSFPTIDFAEVAVAYGKRNNVKVIVDIRDLWPDIFKQNVNPILGFLAYPYIKLMDLKTKKIMQSAYALNSISPEALDWALKKAGRKKRTEDKAYFIGYSESESQNNKKLLQCKIKEGEIVISFFGTINNQFNFKLLVDVAKELGNDDIKFILCGDGPQMKYLRGISRDVKNISLLGWVDNETINYVLNHSFMGFAPYKNTFDFQMGVSNKFGEYLSHSLPVIVTCEGAMENLIHEYQCGIMSMDKTRIANFILKLKKDHNSYQKLRKSAYSLYKNELDASNIYNEIAEYIEKTKGEIKK